MEVKYSVTAMIDLLGFSNHLEVGGYDFRTNIGREALKRLNVLVNAIKLFEEERNNIPEVYPENFFYRRINDAIILTIDLPDILTPYVGATIKRGIFVSELNKYFTKEEMENEEKFKEAYYAKYYKAIQNLMKFIGFIGRLHKYINNQENHNYYPGVKSIVSTGFRLPFITDDIEDFLSANFSFSNAFIAEKYLKGSKLFLDTNIIEILSSDKFARNIFQYACIDRKENEFNPFDNYDFQYELPPSFIKELDKYKINIFRKDYEFREINASPLVYLQLRERLKEYIEGKKTPHNKVSFFSTIFDSIRNGLDLKKLENKEYKGFFINSLKTDLEEDIRIMIELIEDGESKIVKEKRMGDLLIYKGV